MEMLETVLMTTFWVIYVSDFETDDSDESHRQYPGKGLGWHSGNVLASNARGPGLSLGRCLK